MSNLNLNRWRMSRRQMLRGLGASISLPWLNSMGVLPAPAQPKRSVFLYIPNGVNTLTWQIGKAGADYEFTKPLQSLEKHRRRAGGARVAISVYVDRWLQTE